MYREEKYSRSSKIHQETITPSFSSTLLDEIYRSIDGDKPGEFRAHREKPAKKQSAHRAPKAEDGDQTTAFVRACLLDKWIQKSNSDKFNTDIRFFSSTSSSNSDSSGALSSSDTEFFESQTEPKVSCFSTGPKPIKTAPPPRKPAVDDDLVEAKSRALRLYANLKKVKQPISPGGRLTRFINSFFSNASGKKPKNDLGKDHFQSSASASSYSRSCLSKSSPGSMERMKGGSTQRTVRFNPVSVIVEEDLRAWGHKSAFREERDFKMKVYNGKMSDNLATFRKSVIADEEDDGDCYDRMSDASSDLFELDHMAMFGSHKLKCEELPVYETTRMETNRVIASRLIR